MTDKAVGIRARGAAGESNTSRRGLGLLAAALLAGALALPAQARAGVWEFSLGVSYYRTNYGQDGYNWTRRSGLSVGYYFTELGQVELSFQDSTSRTLFVGSQDITTHDQVYSASYVQHLAPRRLPFQPYLKAGIGQLIREAEGSYADGSTPTRLFSTLTGVLAAGMKIKVTQTFGIRGEATTYLEKARINTWRDNVAVTFGASMYF